MNENLEKRKKDYARYLDEAHAAKPQKWWQTREPEYTNTQVVADRGNRFQYNPHEITVKYDLKRALSGSALFFGIYILFAIWPLLNKPADNSASFWITTIIFILAVLYNIFRHSGRNPRLVFNGDGIFIHGNDKIIPWRYLTASYIQAVESDGSAIYKLILYYYDENMDEFKKAACDLNGLDMEYEEIAFHIECRKVRTGTNVVTV